MGEALLFGVCSRDLPSLDATVLVLLILAAVAIDLSPRRAIRVDPVRALAAE